MVLIFPLSKKIKKIEQAKTFSSSSQRTLKTHCKTFRKIGRAWKGKFLFEEAETRDKTELAELET